MAKIERIKKSRKENRCNRCGKTIPVGSPYLKCELGFGPTIVRCTSCGLEHWECTTSEYQLNAGEIQYRWQENYDPSDEGVADAIRDGIQEIYDQEDEKFNNLPENLQYAPVGETIQSRMDACDSAMSELDCIDIDSLKSDAVSEVIEPADDDDETEEEDKDYDELLAELEESDPAKAQELKEKFEELLTDAIQAAVDCLEV